MGRKTFTGKASSATICGAGLVEIANETVAVKDVVSQVPDKMSFWLAVRRLPAPQRD